MMTPLSEIADLRRSQFKQILRRKIQVALWTAQILPAEACLNEIRNQLIAIQNYCDRYQKKFIFIEELITCDRYDLGGSDRHRATLFRGPSEDASVAICVTQKGSLLHRNSCPWIAYKNVGDVQSAASVIYCQDKAQLNEAIAELCDCNLPATNLQLTSDRTP